MKFLALPLLLLGVGAGWFGLQERSAQATEPPCAAQDCRVTVQCTGSDTCLVTCYDENDQIVCQREVTCDGPCEKSGANCPEETCAETGGKGSDAKLQTCGTPCTR